MTGPNSINYVKIECKSPNLFSESGNKFNPLSPVGRDEDAPYFDVKSEDRVTENYKSDPIELSAAHPRSTSQGGP